MRGKSIQNGYIDIHPKRAIAPSSSACSELNMYVIGLDEVETMTGRKVNRMSPVTRQLNKSTDFTM
jgi:hypothetical protein